MLHGACPLGAPIELQARATSPLPLPCHATASAAATSAPGLQGMHARSCAPAVSRVECEACDRTSSRTHWRTRFERRSSSRSSRICTEESAGITVAAWHGIPSGMVCMPICPANVVDDAGEAAPRMRGGCPARLKAAGSAAALWSGGRAVGAAVGWAGLGCVGGCTQGGGWRSNGNTD